MAEKKTIASKGKDCLDELTHTEESLLLSEERLQAILKTAVDAIISINAGGIIDSINPATEKMFGYSKEELIGQNVSMLMPSPLSETHTDYIQSYIKTGKARIIGKGRETIAQRKDGSLFPIDLAVSEIDHLAVFTGVIRDISDRKELQKQVLDIALEENRRIGHELHDSIQQQLAGLSMLAKTINSRLQKISNQGSGINDIKDLVSSLSDGLKESTHQVNLLSHGLVPVEVDADGLRVALSELTTRVSLQHGVKCEFQSKGQVRISDNSMATHLYRITQEAISNAINHGKPDKIKISLSGSKKIITLKVTDDGSGISGDSTEHAGRGLRIMNYRAGLLGANLNITRGKRSGTKITCVINR